MLNWCKNRETLAIPFKVRYIFIIHIFLSPPTMWNCYQYRDNKNLAVVDLHLQPPQLSEVESSQTQRPVLEILVLLPLCSTWLEKDRWNESLNPHKNRDRFQKIWFHQHSAYYGRKTLKKDRLNAGTKPTKQWLLKDLVAKNEMKGGTFIITRCEEFWLFVFARYDWTCMIFF